MAYIIYHKEHGVSALINAPVHTATAPQQEGYLYIPCEAGVDVGDTERWEREAALMIENGWIAPTLEMAKAIKLNQVMRIRDDIVDDGFPYAGFVYPISPDVQLSMLMQFQSSQIMPAPSYQWKDIDGIYRNIGSAEEFQRFAVSAMMYGQSLFAREGMLQELVSQAESIEEVQAITWDTVPDGPV